MTVRLIDLFHTRYMYVTYAVDFEYLLRCINSVRADSSAVVHYTGEVFKSIIDSVRKGENVTLDIAEARVTKDIAPYLTRLQRAGITITDSMLPWRKALYEENRSRIENAKAESIQLPKIDYATSITEYISSLRTDIVYTPRTENRELYLALATLVSASRPSVKLSDSFLLGGLFNYVLRHISIASLESYNRFISLTGEGVRILDFEANESVFVQGYGYVDIDSAIANVPMIPAVFGAEKVLHDPTFELLIQESLRAVHDFQQSRPKTLDETLLRQQEVSNDVG